MGGWDKIIHKKIRKRRRGEPLVKSDVIILFLPNGDAGGAAEADGRHTQSEITDFRGKPRVFACEHTRHMQVTSGRDEKVAYRALEILTSAVKVRPDYPRNRRGVSGL